MDKDKKAEQEDLKNWLRQRDDKSKKFNVMDLTSRFKATEDGIEVDSKVLKDYINECYPKH